MRTYIASAQKAPIGLWSVTLETTENVSGVEKLLSRVESAPLFHDEFNARAAGTRAIKVLEEMGMFPDLTIPF